MPLPKYTESPNIPRPAGTWRGLSFLAAGWEALLGPALVHKYILQFLARVVQLNFNQSCLPMQIKGIWLLLNLRKHF